MPLLVFWGVSEVCPPQTSFGLIFDHAQRCDRIRLLVRALHRRQVAPAGRAGDVDVRKMLSLARVGSTICVESTALDRWELRELLGAKAQDTGERRVDRPVRVLRLGEHPDVADARVRAEVALENGQADAVTFATINALAEALGIDGPG